jgi:hypothetical protein
MWRLYKRGTGLTTGFIGSHTVTHNYSVYTLQLTTVHYSTCRVFLLCLHWLPVFQHRRICSPATVLWRLLLYCRLSTGHLGSHSKTDWLTLGPTTNFSIFWRLALSNSLDRLTLGPNTRLYSSGTPIVESRDFYRARVRHIVYVILITRHVCRARVRHIVCSVILYCCLVPIATVVHKRHIAYSMHVAISYS